MRIFVLLFLFMIVTFLSFQAYRLYTQERVYEEERIVLEEERAVLQEENDAFKADLEYFANDENLAKELRSRFNYRAPDEELLIIVPSAE